MKNKIDDITTLNDSELKHFDNSDTEVIDKLEQQLSIAIKALRFISRPWPQKELADTNFNVAKQALLDISNVE